MTSYKDIPKCITAIVGEYCKSFNCIICDDKYLFDYFGKIGFCQNCCSTCYRKNGTHRLDCRKSANYCKSCDRNDGVHDYVCFSQPHSCRECGRHDGSHIEDCKRGVNMCIKCQIDNGIHWEGCSVEQNAPVVKEVKK